MGEWWASKLFPYVILTEEIAYQHFKLLGISEFVKEEHLREARPRLPLADWKAQRLSGWPKKMLIYLESSFRLLLLLNAWIPSLVGFSLHHTFFNKYSQMQYKDVSVNNGLHRQQWSQKIIMELKISYYLVMYSHPNIIALQIIHICDDAGIKKTCSASGIKVWDTWSYTVHNFWLW